jgi:hypothetical protein
LLDDIRRLVRKVDHLFALHGHKNGWAVAVVESQEDEDEAADINVVQGGCLRGKGRRVGQQGGQRSGQRGGQLGSGQGLRASGPPIAGWTRRSWRRQRRNFCSKRGTGSSGGQTALGHCRYTW